MWKYSPNRLGGLGTTPGKEDKGLQPRKLKWGQFRGRGQQPAGRFGSKSGLNEKINEFM